MSENLEIKIDLNLDDEKAQAQMTQALNSLKDFVNNKANNIDIKVNVDDSGLKNLEKIEKAVKEINKLSKEAQKSLFSSKSTDSTASNSVKEQKKLLAERKKQEEMYAKMFESLEVKERNNAYKEQQKREKEMIASKQREMKEQARLAEERKKQEVQYSQMFDKLEKQKIKEQENMYKDLFDTAIKQEKAISEAKKQERKEQENMYRDMFKDLEKQEKEATALKEKQMKEQEQMYKSMFDSIAKQEAEQLAKSQKERAKNFDSIEKDMQKAQTKIGKLEKSGFVDIDELDKVKSSLKEISDIHVWENIDNLDLTQSRGEMDKILESLKQIDDIRLDGLKDAKIDNFTTKMTNDLDKLEEKFKEIGKSTEGIDRLRAELQGLDSVAPDKLPTTFQRMRQEVSQLNDELRQTTKESSGMGNFLGDISDSMRTFTLGNMIGDGIVSSIRSVTQSFMEMDDAITNVKKVAEETDINSTLKLDGIKSQAIDIAKEVGMASTEVINGIADSLQAGMGSMEQSIAVARSSLMLANVGDMTQSQASSAVNTMIKGFKIDPLKEVTKEMNGAVVKTNELTEAMDMLNHAGNNYAIGTDGVAEALKRGGSVLSEYGVSLGDTVALITSANEAVQNPEKVGNGMKSIAINLAGMKANASEGTLELNKTAKALAEIAGIDVYSDKKTGQVKNMVQIINEVQGKWKDLRDDERLALSEAIAGKQQAMIFQSLMGNFETFKKMREEFANNSHLGSAEAENAQYVDSIAGKLNHLKEVWVSISQTMVSSDFTKGILEGAIKVSEAIDKIIKALDNVNALTPTLVAVGTTFGSIMKTMIGNSKNGVSLFTPKAGGNIFSTIVKDITSAKNETENFGGAVATMQKGWLTLGTNVKSVLGFLGGFALQAVGIFAVTKAVELGIKAWDNYANALKNTEKEIKENITTLNQEISTSKDKLKTLEESKSRYEELISKQREYNKSVKELTDEQKSEMQELISMQNELAETFPELVIGKNSEGNAILSMSTDVDGLIRKMEQAIQQKERLLDGEENKLAKNATKQMQTGEVFGKGTLQKIASEEESYIKDMAKANQNLANAINDSQGTIGRAREDSLKKIESLYNKEQEVAQKHYENQLSLYEEYTQNELEIQNGAFNKLQTQAQNFKGLEGDNKSFMEQFASQINWGELNESGQGTMVRFIDKISSELDKGNPKIKEWTDQWNKANEEMSITGDSEKYRKNLEGIAKGLSEMTNTNFDTVMNGLTQMFPPLDQSQQKLQDFLSKYNSSLLELNNGDLIATKLAEQFNAVNMAIQDMISTENQVDGVVDINVLANLSENEDIPQEIRDFMKGVLADDKVERFEHDTIVSLNTLFLQDNTKFEKELNQLQKVLDGEASDKELQLPIKIGDVEFDSQTLKKLDGWNKLNKDNQIDIKALIDIEGADKLKDLDSKLNTLRENGKITSEAQIIIKGEDKTKLYLDIIKKLKDMPPEIVNKLILENQDAISNLETYDEFVKYLNENPEIITKYSIVGEGIDNVEKAKKNLENIPKETQATLEANVENEESIEEFSETLSDVEGEKEVDIKVSDKQVLNSIDSIETLIKYSAQMKDGQYKLDIQANTAEAVTQLDNLEIALRKISNILLNTPTKTYRIETAQASKNVTGLRNNVEKLKDLMSNISTLVFNSETAQASKNITGLINNVKRFMDLKPKTIVFKSETAQASKNITGLINKIESVPTGTKTITYKVVTKYETQGSPTAQSSGNGGVTRTLNTIENVPVMARTAMPMAEETQQSEPMPLMARATQKTPIAIAGKDIADGLEYNINLLKELEARISMVNNQLSELDKKAKLAVGTEKIKYLQQQNTLYKEQMNILKEQEDALQRQSNFMKYALENKGMKFNSDGNMTNYEEMLIKKEKEVKALEQKASKDKATDAEKKKYESAKSALDELKKYAEEYYKVTFDELPKVKEEWLDLSNSIRENASAIKELEREQKLYTFNSSLRELSMLQDVVADKMDIINEKMKYAGGTDKLKYQQDLIKLLEEEQKIIEQQIKQYEESMKVFQGELKGYGFTFDSEGTIKNLDEILNKYQNSKDLEDVNKILEEYFDIQRDELPDARKEWEKNKNEILDNAEAVKKLKDELKSLTEDSRYKDHNRDIWEVEAKLSQNQINLDNSVGQNKIEYLEERIRLTQELRNETQDLLKFENQRRKELMSELSGYGLKFREDGSIEAYGGKIEELKKTLSEEEFNQVFSKIEEYMDTTYEKIPDLEDKYLELGYSVRDYVKELEKLERERALDPHINKVQKLETEYDKLADRLDIIGIKMKDAYGKDKLALIEEQIKLLEEQKDKQTALAKEYEAMRNVYRNDLSKYGVKFDENGDITNLDSILGEYRDHEDIETLKELIDEYLDIQREKLPDAVKEWEKLNSAIKDAYKEQLNVTKDIENEITAIYKKQVEERKKLIDEELKKRLDAINKEKEAYNKAREEAKYQDNYNDQMDKVQSLEKQLEIAKKDTSLAGQKKVQELLDQLKEEQKKLQDMVQDKIDDQVNDMFDQESDRLQEEADKAKEDLDDMFSDKKIQELVKEALSTGVFEDIDGTMRSLQDVMLEFVDEYGEGLGATGDLIKNELIANLEIAKNTMKDMVDISKELGLIKYSYGSDILNNASRSIPQSRSVGSQSPVINFNESLINIEGNVDKNIVDELRSLSQEIEDNVINTIVRELR